MSRSIAKTYKVNRKDINFDFWSDYLFESIKWIISYWCRYFFYVAKKCENLQSILKSCILSFLKKNIHLNQSSKSFIIQLSRQLNSLSKESSFIKIDWKMTEIWGFKVELIFLYIILDYFPWIKICKLLVPLFGNCYKMSGI